MPIDSFSYFPFWFLTSQSPIFQICQEDDKKDVPAADAASKKKADSDSDEEEQDNQQKEKSGISNKKKKVITQYYCFCYCSLVVVLLLVGKTNLNLLFQLQRRMKIAELKQICFRPDVVEVCQMLRILCIIIQPVHFLNSTCKLHISLS